MKTMMILILAAAVTLGCFSSDSGVTLTDQGLLALGPNIRIEWRHAPAWRGILLRGAKVTHPDDRTETLSGECSFPQGCGAKVTYSLRRDTPDLWQYRASLLGVGDTTHISAEIKIPADRPADLEIGGKLYRLSGKPDKEQILKWTPVRANTFRISSGTESYLLKGDFSVSISDLRFSGGKENYYCIHLHVPESAKEKRFDMNVSIRRTQPAMRPVSIAPIANMGFVDAKPDDGQGGWADQGPGNDLCCMTEFGTREFAGIPFEILNPAQNGGKSCLVRSAIRTYPASGALEFSKPETARYIFLLHAAAWVPKTGEKVGFVELIFADGSQTEIPVIAGKDTGNWWCPVFAFENGAIGWTGVNRSSKVGLFVSAFPIPEKPIARIAFLPAESVWLIAGVSLGNVRPQQNLEKRVTVQEGDDWKPMTVPQQFIAGSAMDFSAIGRLYPARDGALKINADGHFVLAGDPSRRVRFYATNLGQELTIPTHRETDALVNRLAMDGFNSIRIHQFENRLYDWNKQSTLDFNADHLDRFHYLWAKLREKGMYLTTDVLSTRVVRPGDRIEECPFSADEHIRKTLTMFSPSALRNWKDFARKVFTMKNPYTGLSMAEDPALFAVNLDNEAPLYNTWQSYPELAPLVDKVYAEYLREKNIYTPELAKEHGRVFNEFLADRQQKIQREQIRFMKEELGVRAAITNLNNDAKLNLQPFRNELDLVDGHIYHDHPEYPLRNWNVPVFNSQTSTMATGNSSMMNNMLIRIPRKPMIVTELQFCYPNRFRSEIAAMAGAYAALQDWDALYRFAAGHNGKKIFRSEGCGSFDHYYEPMGILTGRIMNFLFVRGDVSPAPGMMLAYGWERPAFHDKFDLDFRELGFYTRIGSAPLAANIPGVRLLPGNNWRAGLPADAARALEHYRRTGVITSATGEITLDRNRPAVSVVTPKSELFTFPGGQAGGKFLKIANSLDLSTVSAHAFDDRPLTRSRDILVYHLTDALNSGTVFQNDEGRVTLKNGGLPILAARGRADLALAVDPAVPEWRVEAIAMDGAVLGTIHARLENRRLCFRAEVFGPCGVTMLYRVRPANR